MNLDTWRGRRVLVTGHTGFKGAWLTEWLTFLGADVWGLALAPPTNPSLSALLSAAGGHVNGVVADVRDLGAVRDVYARARPEVVFHLAAQSLVRAGHRDPLGTYTTNVDGTAHVLEGARGPNIPRAIVVVTSDKVYDIAATAPPFDEHAPLGGADPYSTSKAAAELVTAAYRRSYLEPIGVAVATARAGNVIGGGDWADERLVPDLLRARAAGTPLVLRYPDAVRPWQHVLDPLHGYLLLAERLFDDPRVAPEAVNFGPASETSCTVVELIERLNFALGARVEWSQGLTPDVHETAELRLTSQLAMKTLGWRPRLELDSAVAWTADWHLAVERGDDARTVCQRQIRDYEQLQG